MTTGPKPSAPLLRRWFIRAMWAAHRAIRETQVVVQEPLA